MLKTLCLIFNVGMFIWVLQWIISRGEWPLPFVTFFYLAINIFTLIYVWRTQGFAPTSLLRTTLDRMTLEEKIKIKKLSAKLASGK